MRPASPPGINFATEGFSRLSLNISNAEANAGFMAEAVYDMVWDGTTYEILENGSGDLPNFPVNTPNGSPVQYQAGWQILSRKLKPVAESVFLGGKYPA